MMEQALCLIRGGVSDVQDGRAPCFTHRGSGEAREVFRDALPTVMLT